MFETEERSAGLKVDGRYLITDNIGDSGYSLAKSKSARRNEKYTTLKITPAKIRVVVLHAHSRQNVPEVGGSQRVAKKHVVSVPPEI